MAAKKSRSAKKNPSRSAPRRNQAGKFKVTAAEAKSLTGAAVGGALSGAVTNAIDGVKPPALAMVPSALITVGLGIVLVAATKAPLAKAIGYGMVAHGAGDVVEEFMGPAGAPMGAPKKDGEALVFSNPGHYNSLHHNPGHYSAASKHVGALVTF